jgi:hypothetical protein
VSNGSTTPFVCPSPPPETTLPRGVLRERRLPARRRLLRWP